MSPGCVAPTPLRKTGMAARTSRIRGVLEPLGDGDPDFRGPFAPGRLRIPSPDSSGRSSLGPKPRAASARRVRGVRQRRLELQRTGGIVEVATPVR